MNYFIFRAGQQYGPYAAPDLQRYLEQGSVQYSDLARTETMSEWLPLAQLLQSGQSLPLNPASSGTPMSSATQRGAGPIPPSLHWALVLALGAITGLFHFIWMLIQAAFIRKIDPQSKAVLLYVAGLIVLVGGMLLAMLLAFAMPAVSERWNSSAPMVLVGLLITIVVLGSSSLTIAGAFSIRSSMLTYYNSVEPINLRLSPVMTLFFNTLYIQYHFSRIAKWKETGLIYPQ